MSVGIRSSMRCGTLSLLGPMLLLTPLTVQATPPVSGAVRLAWVRGDAAEDCLSGDELETELVERMGRNPFEGAPRQWIDGLVTRHGERYDVQLFERDAHGKTVGSRKLSETSQNCHVLDEPVVLAIALIIDPNVKLRQHATPLAAIVPRTIAPTVAPTAAPTVAPTAAPTVAPTAAPTVAPCVNSPLLHAPDTSGALANTAGGASETPRNAALNDVGQVGADAATPRAGRDHDAPTKNQSDARDNKPSRFVAGTTDLWAGALLVHGLLPRMAAGVELGSRRASGPYAVALSLRWFPEQRSVNLGEFGFGATEFGLDACYQLPWHRLRWSNCVEFGAGAIHVTVHQPVPLKPGDRLIASLGANTGLGLALVGPLALDARLFGAVSLNPWDFRLVDSNTDQRPSVFHQPLLMLGGAVALTLRLF